MSWPCAPGAPRGTRPHGAPRPGARRWLSALLLLGAATLGGCPPSVPRPPDGIFDAMRLAELAASRRAALRSVRGETKVELFTEEGYSPFSQVVVAQRPALLHIEALSPLDMPVGVLTCDGQNFQLYALGEKTFYHGPATPENIARLIPLPLPPDQLVEVLLGGVPLLGEPRTVDWDERQGRYILRLETSDGRRQAVRLDPSDLAMTSSRVESAKGKLIYELGFSEFERVPESPAVRIPRTLRFEMPAREIEMTLRWKDDRELNPEVPVEAWSQEPPRGAEQIRLP